MSFKYTKEVWGFGFTGKNRAIKKLVMLNLSDRADDDGLCFPSIAKVAEDTLLDRRTVMSAITSLIKDGLLEDTKMRKGMTKQVRVLRILISTEESESSKTSSEGSGGTKVNTGTSVPSEHKTKQYRAKTAPQSNVSQAMKESFEEQGKKRSNVVKGVPDALKHLLKNKEEDVYEEGEDEVTQQDYDECDIAMLNSLNNPVEHQQDDLTDNKLTGGQLLGNVYKAGVSEARERIYNMTQNSYKFSEDY